MPLLAVLGPLGVPELLIIAFIIVVIFGVGRLPEIGGAVGKSIREFRKSTRDDDAPPSTDMSAARADTPAPASSNATAPASAARFCTNCGARNGREAKFCSECGTSMAAAVG